MKTSWLLGTAVALASLTACGEDDPIKTADTGSIRALDVSRQPISSGEVGCQSRSSRYPWGQAQLRTWTPKETQEREHPSWSPGFLTGQPFTARLVQAYGEDYGEASRTVILEMEDGCRRQFRAESFIDGDRALINSEVDNHAISPDSTPYVRVDRPQWSTQQMLDDGAIKLYETPHFAFWYGTRTNGSFYEYIGYQGRSIEQVLEETGTWMEKQWHISHDVLNAPLPYASDTNKQKLDIYLCGTGRPNPRDDDMGDCGAGALEFMEISAWALNKGSVVPVHEFGHMMQYFTHGFRDKDDAGTIWETGAEWHAFAVSPNYNALQESYLDNLEFGPLFSPARYGANPIMTYFFEKDDTRDLVWNTWQRNLRDANGATQEDYFQAFVRLAQQDGIYANGWQSFADDMGWYGARLVNMDFLNQRTLLDQFRTTRTTSGLGSFYVPLVATNQADEFTPPTQRQLLEFGTHIIPMNHNGQPVTVTITGETTANQAAWRFTLVSVDGNGNATYAPMTAVSGTGSASVTMTPASGSKLYLVVTATPYAYETLGWQNEGETPFGTRFPYRARIQGATPNTDSPTACNVQADQNAWTRNYVLAGNSSNGRPCH